MTRKDLTKEYARQIAAEIQRAYNYFGEYEDTFVKVSTERKMKELYENLAEKPDEIQTEEGLLTGYHIDVGLGSEDFPDVVRNEKACIHERIQALSLVVNEDGLQYILTSFDCYRPREGCTFDDYEFENQSYKKVALEDVDKTIVGRSLY
jgi:hypothetical protein